ncbi:MAG: FHA domain-containing protein [Eubacterium sp.]|nr:FHA domain-containing protein [Eubacterium sp.]MBR6172977.1 FHA domain-containing protein [Eubacterium sp.]
MAGANTSYDEFTLNFRVEDDIAIAEEEMAIFNYEFVGNRTTCELIEAEDGNTLQFKIPATLPLEQFLRKQLYKGEFLSILSNILNQLIYFEENSMPFNKLLLNVHYMYIELSTLDIQLIYMPVRKKFADCNITEFIQTFISKVRFANMACVECVEKLLKYLDSKLMFNLEEFYRYVLLLEEETIQEDSLDKEERKPQTEPPTASEYDNPIPYLVRVRTNELIPIIKTEFLIGKSPDADYQITDNRKVSRRHATLRISNGECYIRDHSSTNHTFINGKLIQPEFEIMLANNDYIRMGDEEFKFWIR